MAEQTTGEKFAELAFALAHNSPTITITKTDLAKMIDSALKLHDAQIMQLARHAARMVREQSKNDND